MKPLSSRLHLALAMLTGLAALAGVVGLMVASEVLVRGALLIVGTITAAGILWTNVTLRKLARSLDRSIDRRAGRTESAIMASLASYRKKQSRHEYHHGLALERIEQVTTEVRGDVEGLVWKAFDQKPSTEQQATTGRVLPKVLFVTSNGAGVGHLTRCAAIALAGQSRFDSEILSMSRAADLVTSLGIESKHYPSQALGELPWSTWHRSFGRYFHNRLDGDQYDLVVFDGTWIYRGVTEACRRFDVPLVWSLRGNWRESADTTQRRNAGSYCDVVVQPGDIAESLADVAKIRRVHATAPIVIGASTDRQRPRETARAELGIDPGARVVLVQLGAGVVNDIHEARQQAIRDVLALGPEWHVVLTPSLLRDEELEARPRVHTISKYPLAFWLSAFDFCIIAGGYNAVHEALNARLPSIIWPNMSTSTDAQEHRAAEVDRLGAAVMVSNEVELQRAISKLAEPGHRADMRRACEKAPAATGAVEFANILTGYTEAVHGDGRC